MAKVTSKEQILQFVESQGSARYTEIQRFIVDRKFGAGTYDSGYQVQNTWVWNKRLNRSEMRPRKLNSYRGYYSTNLRPEGYLRKGLDRLIKYEDGTFHVLRSLSPSSKMKTATPKVERQFPRFKSETRQVIAKLQQILRNTTETNYNTLGEFYREIELLKFPYLSFYKHSRNQYSQQQYESIRKVAEDLGWIMVVPKDYRSYNVIINKAAVLQELPDELRTNVKPLPFAYSEQSTQELTAHAQDDMMKAAQRMMVNSIYGAFPKENTDPIINLEISLDPAYTWVIKTINGKNYLSIK